MKKVVVLLVMAAFLQGACNGMSASGRSDSVTGRAATCAMCGASVSDNYSAWSSFRAIGPGNY